MKISPIIREMNRYSEIEHILVHTGQHYDQKMSDVFFDELKIPKPDVTLDIGSDTHSKQVAKIMSAFEDVCDEFKPDLILVVGDVNSTMACTLVAAKKNIKVAHVEAGIRSFDRKMPEEINRLVTDSVSDYFLPPSPEAVQNLQNEGHRKDQIELVGNVMIDNLKFFKHEISSSNILKDLIEEKEEYVSLTLHRPSNVDNKDNLTSVIEAIDFIQSKIKIIFPIHPRTVKMIEKFGLKERVDSMNNLILIDPVGYFDFGKLISNSKFVLTDSGGIQEETTVYGIPCITLRENTERPITVTEGSNELAGNNTEKIIELSNTVFEGNWKESKVPNLWDGKASERIVKYLLKNIS